MTLDTPGDRRLGTLLRKARTRGLGWVWRRLVAEARTPDTPVGRRLAPAARALALAWAAPGRTLARITADPAVGADTLFLIYDLEVAPVTFDLVIALALADADRRRAGLGRLRVVFVPGPLDGLRFEPEDYARAVPADARRWRLHHLLTPMCWLAPACAGVTVAASRAEAAALFRTQVDHHHPPAYLPAVPRAPDNAEVTRRAAAGEDLACLAAPPAARAHVAAWLAARAEGRAPVTVTLRGYGYMADRDSDRAAWAGFVAGLDRRRFLPILVPDLDQAAAVDDPLFPDVARFPEAVWNLHLRMALYEAAHVNLGVNGGPMALCWFNPRCRYLLFKQVVEGAPQTTLAAFLALGFQPGIDPPFAGPGQRWVWAPDDQPTIEAAFARFIADFPPEPPAS
jgi:hypothetical protein